LRQVARNGQMAIGLLKAALSLLASETQALGNARPSAYLGGYAGGPEKAGCLRL